MNAGSIWLILGIIGMGPSVMACGASDHVCDRWRLDGGRTGSLAGICGRLREPSDAVRTIIWRLSGGGALTAFHDGRFAGFGVPF